MTTIATDGISVAGNTLPCRGDERLYNAQPKITRRQLNGKEIIFAQSGVRALANVLIEWYLEGADPSNVPRCERQEDGYSVLTIFQNGKIFSISSFIPYREEHEIPYATGTGREYAIGAMEVGASPKEAVEAAIRRDIHSNGDVQVVNLPVRLQIKPSQKLQAAE